MRLLIFDVVKNLLLLFAALFYILELNGCAGYQPSSQTPTKEERSYSGKIDPKAKFEDFLPINDLETLKQIIDKAAKGGIESLIVENANGFHIKELGVTINLQPNYYIVNGQVESICNININPKEKIAKNCKTVLGIQWNIINGNDRYYIIITVKQLNSSEFAKSIVTGHEYGHLLYRLRKQDLIYNQFRNPGLVRKYIKNEGDFANICGLIAVKRAGYLVHLADYEKIGGEMDSDPRIYGILKDLVIKDYDVEIPPLKM